jgi:hypothetical protein
MHNGPAFITEVFIQAANRAEVLPVAAVTLFFIRAFTAALAFLALGWRESLEIGRTFSRLFVFPARFVDNLALEAGPGHVIPENMLVVTVISDIGKIYAVSDNSPKIIGKLSTALIDTLFCDLFTPSHETGPHTWILHSADRNRQRVFKAHQVECGQIVQYMMIEENATVLAATNRATLETHLANFVTPYFAQYFSTGFISSAVFPNVVCIFVTAIPSLPVLGIDQFFSALVQLTKTYQNVKTVKVMGNLIVLVVPARSSIIAPLVFLRVLVQTKNIAGCFDGIVIEFFDMLEMTLDSNEEPFVDWSAPAVGRFESALNWITHGSIGVGPSCLQRLPARLEDVPSRERRTSSHDGIRVYPLPLFLEAVQTTVQ